MATFHGTGSLLIAVPAGVANDGCQVPLPDQAPPRRPIAGCRTHDPCAGIAFRQSLSVTGKVRVGGRSAQSRSVAYRTVSVSVWNVNTGAAP